MSAFQQQDRAAKAVRVERQAGDIIYCLLNARGAVAGLGFDHNTHRCVGNRAAATGVAAMGKVRHAIATLVRRVNEMAVLADGDDRCVLRGSVKGGRYEKDKEDEKFCGLMK